MYIAPEVSSGLKKFITYSLDNQKNENGRVALVDNFHIGGYMCEPDRIERLIFPIIDKYFEEQEELSRLHTSFSTLADIEEY